MLAKTDLTFFLQLAKNFREIGSVFPSSRALAEKMVAAVSPENSPQNILEVGPGSGPMTRVILEKMGPEDQLTVCEINSELIRKLQENLRSNDYFLKHQDRVTFFDGPVQDLMKNNSAQRYDVIVCSLPFMIFPAALVDELMSAFHKMLAPGGTFTNFEYLLLPNLNKLLTSSSNKKRVKEIGNILSKWRNTARENGGFETEVTLLNIPPARTFKLNFSPTESSVLESNAALAAR